MKEHRHRKIKEIVSQREVETQEELVLALENAGFHATQATVSRDVKELKLIKVVGSDGRYKYAIPINTTMLSVEGFRRKLTDVFVSLTRAQNLLVLKVLPGNAHSIGAILDGVELTGLLGTIAGDDTLLLICRDEQAAQWVDKQFSL